MRSSFIVFLLCALIETFTPEVIAFDSRTTEVTEPTNYSKKTYIQGQDSQLSKEFSALISFGNFSKSLKNVREPSRPLQKIAKKRHRKKRNSDSQTTCVLPPHVEIQNNSRRAQKFSTSSVDVNIFPITSFKLKIILFLCCDSNDRSVRQTFTFCSSTLNEYTTNVWQLLQIQAETRLFTGERKNRWLLKITSKNGEWINRSRYIEPHSFKGLNINFESGNVVWYSGPPPKCTETQSSATPATTLSDIAEIATTPTNSEMNMTSEAHASSDALTGLHLLWLLLPLVVILVVVCAVVVVQRKKAKTNAPRQISDSFRRESINSLYGVAAETRKTSINSLYGVDLRPDSSNHIYANDDHRHTSVSGAGDRNKGGLTATRSWVDPQRGNAYYEADPPHHASLSTKPHLYDNQC